MLIVLPRECTGHSKYPLSSLYTVSKTNTLYAVSIQSAKTRPGADYGSDHELLIAKFRLKLKKTGTYTKQSWVFFGRNDAKAETPVLWPPHVKS